MSLTIALAAVLAIAVAFAYLGRNRARGMRSGGSRLNSLPAYHAGYVFLWAALPALLALAAWSPIQSGLVEQAVLASPAGQQLPEFDMVRDTILSEAYEIATGQREAGFNPESTALAPVYRATMAHYAAFAGISHGQKVHDFLERLLAARFASAFRVGAWIRADAGSRWFSEFHSSTLLLGDPGAPCVRAAPRG